MQSILKGIYGRAVKSIWNGSFANYSAAIFSTTLKQWNPLEDTDVIFSKGYSKALCALAATLVGIPVEAFSNMVLPLHLARRFDYQHILPQSDHLD